MSNASAMAICPQWFAVMSKPRGEGRAQLELERQGFHVFLPRHQLRLRTAEGMRTVIRPVFPRYLFLRADASQQSLAPVRSTRGISGLVSFGGKPTVVPEQVIAAIQARVCAQSGLVQLAPPNLVAGDRVQVSQGPLMGLEGIFHSTDGDARVRVLLKLLGQEQSVVLPSEFLVARRPY